jgi:hypothetical protein
MTHGARALSSSMLRCVLALLVLGGTAHAAPWTAAGEGGVVIDWSAGALRAKGVGPADRHAPSPTVARVGARRAAEQQARAKLLAAARALPFAAGGTIGDAIDRDEAAAARLAREVELAPVVVAELGTDGSARVTIALGVEAVRQAIAGPRGVAGGGGAATVYVIDASRVKPPPAPAVGIALDVGGARWDGPIVWVRERGDNADAVAGTASAATGGVLTVSGMSSAPPAGALVVVVVPEKKR